MSTAAVASGKTLRMVDRNGMRGGAGISAVAILIGYAFAWGPIVPIVAAALGIGALFGPKRGPLGALYRTGKKTLKLDIPVEPEEEAPPRFAQAVGFVFLAAATITYYTHHTTGAWVLALIVVALQALLASTGICVGCEVYNLGRRFARKGTP
jgi:Domain of unknown function (DUF4395)